MVVDAPDDSELLRPASRNTRVYTSGVDSDGPYCNPGDAHAGYRAGNPHAIRYSKRAFRHSGGPRGGLRQRLADGIGVPEWCPHRRRRKDFGRPDLS